MPASDYKTALVTGASTGMGRAIAERLAEKGLKVHAVARNAKSLEELAATNGNIVTHVLDVSDTEAVTKVVSGLDIDVLVNCAGITRDTTLKKMSPEQWGEVINCNLNSVFNTCRCVLEDMLESGYGRIVNISSINGRKGQFGQANYAAAKAGMHGLTMSLAQETATKGITVNTLSPGYIATDMIMKIPEKIRESIREGIPVKRFGEPEEIARAVCFLADRDSGFITGANLDINGGQFMG